MNDRNNSDNLVLDLSGLSEQDLLDMKVQLDTEITSIKLQLEKAKVKAAESGEYADRNWWYKATSALRIKGVHSQQIQVELSKLKRSNRKSLYEKFVDVSRKVLSEEVFNEILRKAKAL